MSHPEHPQSPLSPEEAAVTDAVTDIAPDEAADTAASMQREAPEATGKDAIAAFAAQTPVGANGKKRRRAGKKARRWPVLVASLAAVAVLAGVAALFIFVFTPPEDEPEPEYPDTSVVLVDKGLGEDGKELEKPVKSIHVSSRLDEYTIKLNDDGILALVDEADLPTNSTNVDALVDALVYVEAEDTIVTDATADVIAEYGLDNPTATVEVTFADDSTVKLELAALAVGDHYYLRLNGGNTIYLVDSVLPTEVMQTAEAFIGFAMITAPAVGSADTNGSVVMKELSLTGRVRNKQITTLRRREEADKEYENSAYLLTEPYVSDTDSTVVTSITGTTSVIANDVIALHPTEAQLEEYGLKDPYSVAKIVLAVYTYTTDDNGEVASEGYYNETNHLLILGNKDEDGNYYAMADAMDVVFLVEPNSVPWAEKTYQDLANQYLFLRNLNTLSSITCTTDKAYKFQFEHFPEEEDLDEQLRVTMDGKQYDTDQFRELYKVLMTLYRTGAAPAEPEGEPLLTVRVEPIDPSFTVKEISIYNYSGSVYIARAENGDTYKVTASRVDDAIAQLNNYLNGENVINRF